MDRPSGNGAFERVVFVLRGSSGRPALAAYRVASTRGGRVVDVSGLPVGRDHRVTFAKNGIWGF